MRLWKGLILGGVLCLLLSGADADEITVAAAADLARAFPEIGKLYEAKTGHKVIFSFGSSGQLALQAENGAPFDILASANIAYIDDLEKKGLVLKGTKKLYAQGRITLWQRPDAKVQITRLEELTRPEIQKVAIANPDHAPYGKAAREALIQRHVWDKLQPKLVRGENIRQTLQMAETGNVDVAIVALSLSIGSQGKYTLIPARLHKPLNQALAVLKSTRNPQVAKEFAAFINGPLGRPVMKRYGFLLPEEIRAMEAVTRLKK